MTPTTDLRAQALEYHRNLPERIREYLRRERGIADEVIDLHFLGWNGQRITLPIPECSGQIVAFKFAKDPPDTTDSPKMLATPGARAELYGWERVLAKPEQIIICEGEFDRLVLESQGFAAVTSTGGALTFRREWGPYFDPIPSIYVCFDNDDAGREGAQRVADVIPRARIVRLPEEVGEAGDVTDFFVRLGRGRAEFEQLLGAAQPLPIRLPAHNRPSPPEPPPPGRWPDIQELKSRVPIANIVGRYVPLHPSAGWHVGRCPFHDDQNPSFVVFPSTATFHCFGCRAHGDVIDFLMRIEKVSFKEALDVLRSLSRSHG
jgi:DNA primase